MGVTHMLVTQIARESTANNAQKLFQGPGDLVSRVNKSESRNAMVNAKAMVECTF
jgi:hypothetical protein